MDRRTFLSLALVAPVLPQTANPRANPTAKPASKPAAGSPARASAPRAAGGVPWTQWGGPHRNFQTEASGLKDTWPAGGPKVIWKRPLGEGYSSTAVENGVLYTMYGKPQQEIVLAANAETGQTIWEQPNAITFKSDAAPEQGNGPYSTPLILDDRVFTTGVAGHVQCLDKRTGKVLWVRELWAGEGGTRMMYGYAASPLAFRDTILLPVGGRGKAVMAFKQADGSVAWSKNDLPNTYSSPILIDVGGLEQLAAVMDGAVVGVNPYNGDLQWQVPFKADYSIAVATPLWGPDNLMFVSAEYNAGSKMLELRRNGQQTQASELWSSNRLRLHNGNAMRVGDVIYFSSGGKFSQAILSAVEARTGKILWQERSIEKATFVWADNKLITLDQDGNLMIAHPSPQGFQVSAKTPLMTNLSWTPPVLVGTRLYLRDRRNMMAVDLG